VKVRAFTRSNWLAERHAFSANSCRVTTFVPSGAMMVTARRDHPIRFKSCRLSEGRHSLGAGKELVARLVSVGTCRAAGREQLVIVYNDKSIFFPIAVLTLDFDRIAIQKVGVIRLDDDHAFWRTPFLRLTSITSRHTPQRNH
jgi:hypothetical protein